MQPGWLDCLIAPFIIHDNIGLVGSQLIYPNGQLQEAGGIIWSDGSGLNYGRMDDPQKPEYNYLRDVDYCSGCSIAIKKALFDTIGGFDTRFVPAYYEDTDLAFTVREMGYRVVYQPASKLIHHEGITSGTDINSGIKAYQEINKINFVNKWSRQLSLHRKPGDTPDLAKERIVIGSILFIDAVTPTPDMDSGSVDAFFYLYILSKLNYKITFIPDNIQFNQGYTQALQQIGIECIYKPYIKSIEEYISAHSNKFDYIFISRVNIAIKYIDFIKVYCPQAKIIFNTVDIHYIRQARQAWISKSLNLLHIAKKTKKAELKLLRESDISIVISSSEINHLKKIDPELNLFHIPLMLDMHQSKTGFANRKDIIFLGGFEHEPNVDAVIYFVQDIWPIVKEKLPDINFIIIGSKMPKKIQQLHNINGIIITGYVKILSTYFDSCKISIAPLRYGAGQKGKLARSGSYGVPAVVTPLAAEGMNLEHNKHVLIAKSPESFAENIIKLYLDKTLWEKLSINIYEYTKKQFSLEMGKNRLINLTALLQDDTSYQKNTSDP